MQKDIDSLTVLVKNVPTKNDLKIEGLQNEKRMIQEAVDSLFDNSRLKELGWKPTSDKEMFLYLFSNNDRLLKVKQDLQQIRDKSNLLFEQDKNNKLVTKLITGVTKHGVLGEEFFEINNSIVSLDVPFLTDEAKDNIKLLMNENLDPEGTSYKNTMKMMMEDGLFNVLPKSDDAWIKFLNPFLRLTRKEKNKRIIKIKNYE